MGSFSFTFADYGNMRNLTIGESCYLYCPDGTIVYEPSYGGYGEFAGQDVYGLVADWNRKFLCEHPEFEILGTTQEKKQPVSRAEWYPVYADLHKSQEEVATLVDSLSDWRNIGINIACYNWQNEKLPYPIKIAKKGGYTYQQLPASHFDPAQGSTWHELWRFTSDICKEFEQDILKSFEEMNVTSRSQISYEFAKGMFCIRAKEESEEAREIFSIPFIAERPTKSVVRFVEKIMMDLRYQLQDRSKCTFKERMKEADAAKVNQKRFIVTVDTIYIRDSQVFCNQENDLNDNTVDEDWCDFSAPLYLGVVNAADKGAAIRQIADQYKLPVYALRSEEI